MFYKQGLLNKPQHTFVTHPWLLWMLRYLYQAMIHLHVYKYVFFWVSEDMKNYFQHKITVLLYWEEREIIFTKTNASSFYVVFQVNIFAYVPKEPRVARRKWRISLANRVNWTLKIWWMKWVMNWGARLFLDTRDSTVSLRLYFQSFGLIMYKYIQSYFMFPKF